MDEKWDCPACGRHVIWYKEVGGDRYYYHDGDGVTVDVCQMAIWKKKEGGGNG